MLPDSSFSQKVQSRNGPCYNLVPACLSVARGACGRASNECRIMEPLPTTEIGPHARQGLVRRLIAVILLGGVACYPLCTVSAADRLGPEVKETDLPRGARLRLGSLHLRHLASTQAVVWFPAGKLLASTGKDATIRVWDADTGAQLAKFTDSPSSELALAVSPDGELLAWSGEKGIIRVVRWKANERIYHLKEGEEYVTSLAFSPDGRHLATGGMDRTIRVWDLKLGKAIATLTGHREAVYALQYTRDGKQLVSGSADGTVRLWTIPAGRESLTIHWPGKEAHSSIGYIKSLTLSDDGRTVAVAANAPVVRIFDLRTGAELRHFRGDGYPLLSVALSPDGKKLAAGGSAVWVWDVETGKLLQKLPAALPCSLAFAPDGRTLAATDHRGLIRLWDVSTAADRYPSPRHLDEVTAVGFSSDGKVVATCDKSDTLLLWNAVNGQPIPLLKSQPWPVSGQSAIFAVGGKNRAVMSDRRSIRFLDPETLAKA